MIKNEKQYKISSKKLKEIEAEIEKVTTATDQHPLRNKLLLASLQDMQQQLQQQITAYDVLKTSKSVLQERLIEELPTLLIEYKIRSGLTQKEFSEQLGLKEQQLQRYEADNFKGVTFKNLLKFLAAIGMQIIIKETRFTRTNTARSKQKKQSPK